MCWFFLQNNDSLPCRESTFIIPVLFPIILSCLSLSILCPILYPCSWMKGHVARGEPSTGSFLPLLLHRESGPVINYHMGSPFLEPGSGSSGAIPLRFLLVQWCFGLMSFCDDKWHHYVKSVYPSTLFYCQHSGLGWLVCLKHREESTGLTLALGMALEFMVVNWVK